MTTTTHNLYYKRKYYRPLLYLFA